MGEHKRPRAPSQYRVTLGQELRKGVSAGLIMAGLYCSYVLVLYVLRGAAPFENYDITLGAVMAGYIASGLLGGVAYGLLNPLRHTLLGKLVLGVVIASLVFFAVTITMSGPPTHWQRLDWEGVGFLGLLFGVACGSIAYWRRW